MDDVVYSDKVKKWKPLIMYCQEHQQNDNTHKQSTMLTGKATGGIYQTTYLPGATTFTRETKMVTLQ
jgi:hypothetical protein